MAFKVNATTVIDNQSQHLIANSTGQGGVGNRVFTAYGAVTAGFPVILMANGSVANVSNLSSTYTSGSVSFYEIGANVAAANIKASYDYDTQSVYYTTEASGSYATTAGTVLGLFKDNNNASILSNTTPTRVANSGFSYGSSCVTDPSTGLKVMSWALNTSGSNYEIYVCAFDPGANLSVLRGSSLLVNTSTTQTYAHFNQRMTKFIGDANNTFFSTSSDTSDTLGASIYAVNTATSSVTLIASNNSFLSGSQKYAGGAISYSNTTSGYTEIFSFWDSSGQKFVAFKANSSVLLVANSASIANSTGWDNNYSSHSYCPGFYYDSATARILNFWSEFNTANCMHWGCYQIGYSGTTPTLTQIGYGDFTIFGNTNPSTFDSCKLSNGSIAFAYRKSNNHNLSVGSFDFNALSWTWSISNTTYYTGANAYMFDNAMAMVWNDSTGCVNIIGDKDVGVPGNASMRVTTIRLGSNYKSYVGMAANSASSGANVEVALPGSFLQLGANVSYTGASYYVDPRSASGMGFKNTGVKIGSTITNNVVFLTLR